ncbi:hypothetical protein KFE98_10265 [bacterium SCSIO 12741]|nr:hypothetical protein KFE98_10265 [bacterium SCSIO 12741]
MAALLPLTIYEWLSFLSRLEFRTLNMTLAFGLVAFVIMYLLFLIYEKHRFLKLRNKSEKKFAIVKEYRKEKAQLRNNYSQLDYPYIKVEKIGNDELVRLRYANSLYRYFKIGEVVEVFYMNGNWLYWSTPEKGINKYLPPYS